MLTTRRSIIAACALASLAAANTGCLVASGVYAAYSGAALIGESVNDAEVKELHGELIGQSAQKADEKLGKRTATLVDTSDVGHQLLVYPIEDSADEAKYFAVEVNYAKITAISKNRMDKESDAKIAKKLDLDEKFLGKTADQCQANAKLPAPAIVMRDKESGETLRAYDVSRNKEFGGAKLCVLTFDGDAGLCRSFDLVKNAKTLGSSRMPWAKSG